MTFRLLLALALALLCALHLVRWRLNKSNQYKIPRLFHTIWLCNPFKPFLLVGFDSVFQYTSNAHLKIHIVTPEGITEEELEAVRRRHEEQLKPLMQYKDVSLELVYHTDFAEELVGSPVEGLGMMQRHFGGTIEGFREAEAARAGNDGDRKGTGMKGDRRAVAHPTNIVRSLILWREGGVYYDSDVLFTRDIFQVVEETGPFAICENHFEFLPADEGAVHVPMHYLATNYPGHPFPRLMLEYHAEMIKKYGPEGVCPYDGKKEGLVIAPWGTMGAQSVSFGWEWFRTKGRLVHDELQDRRRGGRTFTYDIDGDRLSMMPYRDFAYTTWKQDTLRHGTNPKDLAARLKGYAMHLWEQQQDGSSENVRGAYVKIVENRGTMMSAIHFVICRAYCDVGNLKYDVELQVEESSGKSTLDAAPGESAAVRPAWKVM